MGIDLTDIEKNAAATEYRATLLHFVRPWQKWLGASPVMMSVAWISSDYFESLLLPQ